MSQDIDAKLILINSNDVNLIRLGLPTKIENPQPSSWSCDLISI